MLQVMSDTECVLKAILSLMSEAASPCDPNQYKTGFWGRAQVVSCAMTLLVSWAFSEPLVKMHLFQYSNLVQLLKRLVLDDPEVWNFFLLRSFFKLCFLDQCFSTDCMSQTKFYFFCVSNEVLQKIKSKVKAYVFNCKI